jgi:hypothetical protein
MLPCPGLIFAPCVQAPPPPPPAPGGDLPGDGLPAPANRFSSVIERIERLYTVRRRDTLRLLVEMDSPLERLRAFSFALCLGVGRKACMAQQVQEDQRDQEEVKCPEVQFRAGAAPHSSPSLEIKTWCIYCFGFLPDLMEASYILGEPLGHNLISANASPQLSPCIECCKTFRKSAERLDVQRSSTFILLINPQCTISPIEYRYKLDKFPLLRLDGCLF